MAEHPWTPEELQALAALGLSITPHANPRVGWGYTWLNRDWVGPLPTPSAAIHAAFTEARLSLQFRSAAPFTQQVGELWRWDGQEEGWFHVGGPDTKDDVEPVPDQSTHEHEEVRPNP